MGRVDTCHLSVLNERMCHVTAAAITSNRILTHVKGMKKSTVESMVTHNMDMATTFVFKGMALFTLNWVM